MSENRRGKKMTKVIDFSLTTTSGIALLILSLRLPVTQIQFFIVFIIGYLLVIMGLYSLQGLLIEILEMIKK